MSKVIRIIARLNVGGPAKHVVWLTAGLDDYETLLVAGTVPEGEGDMGYFADEANIVPHFIPEMSREISAKDLITIWKLFRLFLREKPDLIHTHTAKAGTVGRVAGLVYRWLTPTAVIGKPRRTKFVHTYHGHIFHSYYGNLKTKVFISIEKLLATLVTDRIVVISEQQASEICDQFGVGNRKQIRVIPLGLDLDVFEESRTRRSLMRTEFGIDDETILVGIVGRLTEIKNHEMFLDAAAEFKKRDSAAPVRFVIVGDGGLRTQLESRTRELGLTEAVIFAGERNDPAVFYPALDVVALTSRNEGTPLTLIEAMANARPVIATNVGGVVDLLGPIVEDAGYKICERGIGVPAGDVQTFASGLQKLVGDAALRDRLGAQGFSFVYAKYPKQRLLADIRNLYGELLEQSPSKVEADNAVQSREAFAELKKQKYG
jgi:glycosyltransferase involved in cell wall biosynthesis